MLFFVGTNFRRLVVGVILVGGSLAYRRPVRWVEGGNNVRPSPFRETEDSFPCSFSFIHGSVQILTIFWTFTF